MRSEFIKNKIGFIPPENWKVYKLGELTEINSDSLGAKTSPDRRLKYIDLGSVNTGAIDLPADEFIFEDAPSRARRIISAGDILMSTVRPNLKGFARADDKLDGYVCSTGFAVLSAESKVDSKLIYQSLFSESFERQFHQLLVGSSYPAINNSDVEKLYLALPIKKEERENIAEILTTWDEAISKTEKLINAKKRYKKGLMQRLLSGRVRFSGFEGEGWVEVKLKKFFKPFSDKNKDNEDLPILSCSKVHGITLQSNIFDKRVASKDIKRYKVVERDDLIYDPMLLWDASIGFLKEVDRGVISPAYNTFKFKKNSGYRPFFEYLFDTHYMRYNYKAISQGTNRRRRKAPAEAFLSIDVKVPKSIDEQKKIASVLGSLTKEIELLIEEITLYQKQKKGLMQQLLTGKVRVNNLN